MVLLMLDLAESATSGSESPIRLPPVTASTCRNATTLISQQLQIVAQQVTDRLGEACLSKRRVVRLNMSDASARCPGTWSLVESPVRGCLSSLTAAGCDSVLFPTGGPYSQVCGRIIGYQKGSPDAFYNASGYYENINGPYIDGVSLTHGAPNKRQHIWSFVSAFNEHTGSYQTIYNCPCSNTGVDWPHQIPSFIGNNYFCDSGLAAPPSAQQLSTVYDSDPLWDGKGCGSTSTCCQFNKPPWFYANLPGPTSDDLELRICQDEGPHNENVIVAYIELYVSN